MALTAAQKAKTHPRFFQAGRSVAGQRGGSRQEPVTKIFLLSLCCPAPPRLVKAPHPQCPHCPPFSGSSVALLPYLPGARALTGREGGRYLSANQLLRDDARRELELAWAPTCLPIGVQCEFIVLIKTLTKQGALVSSPWHRAQQLRACVGGFSKLQPTIAKWIPFLNMQTPPLQGGQVGTRVPVLGSLGV